MEEKDKSLSALLSDAAVVAEIDRILHNGDSVELKREGGHLVIVEIRRRKRIKEPL